MPLSAWKNGCTTISGETSGLPLGSWAMPSKKRIAWNASSESWLEPSFVAHLRITTRLSGEPDEIRVRFRLAIRLQNKVVAITTRAITATVNTVRVPRAIRLRQLYESGRATGQNTSRSVWATLRRDAPSAGTQPDRIPMKNEIKKAGPRD